MKLTRIALLAVFTQLISFNLQAETLAEAVEKCRVVSNSLKRLVCYDQLAQRAQNLEDSDLAEFYAERPLAAPTPGEFRPNTPAPTRSAPRNNFGLEERESQQKKDETSEMSAVVGAVEEDPYGKLIVTLADGQIWRQTDSEVFKLRSGDSVTISRGLLGSFYLQKDGLNRRMRVKRES